MAGRPPVLAGLVARRRRARSWPPLRPGAFGAYEAAVNGSYSAGPAARLTYDHLALPDPHGRRRPGRRARPLARRGGTRARTSIRPRARSSRSRPARSSSSRSRSGRSARAFSPHLLGRDLAALPPVVFAVFAVWLGRGGPRPRLVTSLTAVGLLARARDRAVERPRHRRRAARTRSGSRSCSTTRSAGGRRPSSRSSARSSCCSSCSPPRLELLARRRRAAPRLGHRCRLGARRHRDGRRAGRARRRAARLDRPQRLVRRRLRLQRRPRCVDGRVGAAVLEPAHRPRRLDHPPLRPGADHAARGRARRATAVSRSTSVTPSRTTTCSSTAHRSRTRTRGPNQYGLTLWELQTAGAAVDARRGADSERRHHRTRRRERVRLRRRDASAHASPEGDEQARDRSRRASRVDRAHRVDARSWHGEIHVPASHGPAPCTFTIRPDGLLGSTLIAFVR